MTRKLKYDSSTRPTPWWRNHFMDILIVMLLVGLVAYLVGSFLWRWYGAWDFSGIG
jgi:hypothetical protein